MQALYNPLTQTYTNREFEESVKKKDEEFMVYDRSTNFENQLKKESV